MLQCYDALTELLAYPKQTCNMVQSELLLGFSLRRIAEVLELKPIENTKQKSCMLLIVTVYRSPRVSKKNKSRIPSMLHFYL